MALPSNPQTLALYDITKGDQSRIFVKKVSDLFLALQGSQGPPGPAGPTGPTGPVAPPVSATVAGSVPSPGSVPLLGFRTDSGGNPLWSGLEYVDVLLFGADRTGATDSHAAIVNALAAVNTGTGGTLFFPAGTYKILSAISVTLGSGVSICLAGAGQDDTVLYWPNNTDGITITYGAQGFPAPASGSTVRDIVFVCGSVNVQAALTFSDPSYATGATTDATNVYNCTFRGFVLGKGWLYGIRFDRVPNTNVYNCLMYGHSNTPPFSMVGIYYVGSATAINTQFTVFGLTTFFTDKSIYCADYVQGLMMTACSFTACNDGVYVFCPAALQFQFSLFNSQINSIDACIRLNNVALCQIVGNLLSSAYGGVVNTFGIVLTNCSGITIIGNMLEADGAFSGNYQGISVLTSDGSTYPIVIDGNSFGYLMSFGVVIDNSSKGVTVGRSNAFASSVTYKVSNQNGANNFVGIQHLTDNTTLNGAVTCPVHGAATVFGSRSITATSTLTWDGLGQGSQVYLRVQNTSGSPLVLKMAGVNPTLSIILGKTSGVDVDLLAVGLSIANGTDIHFQGMCDGGGILLLQYD